MRTIDYFSDPVLRAVFLPPVAAGVVIVVLCSVLSVLVVLKRLSFVGQGVSHAAFGAVGLVVILGIAGGASVGGPVSLIVIAGFCIGAAMLMSLLSERRTIGADTAIGIVLSGTMALGAMLIALRARMGGGGATPSLEAVLFGSILGTGVGDAWTASIAACAVLGVLWWFRRPVLFWAIDEESSPAFGVSSHGMRTLLMVLLAISIVTAMRLAGVVLATALLVLPGAVALKLSSRLWWVVGMSVGSGVLGLLGGLVVSFETDLPTGTCIVLALVLMYAAVSCVGVVRRVARSSSAAASGV